MFSEVANINFSSNSSSEEPLSFLDQEWNDTPAERLSRTGHTVVSVFLGSIMIFGFLNNLIVLILFCKFKTLRTPVNMLLLNISVSDMLVCVCGTTLSFASSIQARWLYGRHGCMWYGFVNSCFGKFILNTVGYHTVHVGCFDILTRPEHKNGTCEMNAPHTVNCIMN